MTMTSGPEEDLLPGPGMVDLDDVPLPDTGIDASSAVASFNSQIAPDEPVIREPESGDVFLLSGWVHEDEVFTHAHVRELRGSDEEAVSKLNINQLGQDAYFVMLEDMIVRRATESIGGMTPREHPKMLSSLLIGDRGLLFANILLATYGPTKEYDEVECPTCQALNDIQLDWYELLDIKGGNTGDKRTIHVDMKDGSVVEVRFPTGEDQLAVVKEKKDATEPERNTFLLARCITNDNLPNKRQYLLDLSMPERAKLIKAVNKTAPSVGFKECEVPCPSCETPMKWTFSWADLLLL